MSNNTIEIAVRVTTVCMIGGVIAATHALAQMLGIMFA